MQRLKLILLPIAIGIVCNVTLITAQDTTQVKEMIAEAETAIQEQRYDDALSIYEEAYPIAKAARHYNFQRGLLYQITSFSFSNGDFDRAIEATATLNELALAEEDFRTAAHTSLNLGHIYMQTEDYDNAIKYVKEGIQTAENQKDTLYICDGQMLLGSIFLQKEEFEKSFELTLSSLKLAENIKDTSKILTNIRTIAILFTQEKKDEEALEYLLRAEPILEASQFPAYETPATFNMIGAAYQRLEKLDLSVQYLQRGLKYVMSNDKPNQFALYKNLGETYIKRKEYKEAIYHLRKAEPLGLLLNHKENLSNFYHSKSKAYLYNDENSKALKNANLCRSYADSSGTLEQLAKAEELLAEIYEKKGNSREALIHFKNYKMFEDSLETINNRATFDELQVQYETEKKEKEILAQNSQIEILNRKNAFQYLLIISILIGAGLIGVLSWLYVRWRNLQREKEVQAQFAQQLIQGQEGERKRIARELHDSIGHALLLIKNKFILSQSNTSDINSMIDTTINEVRSLSRNLHPHQLEESGLTNTLELMVEKIGDTVNIFTSSNIEPVDGIWTPTQELAIYRIVQEAFNNIIKHSDANAANLTIQKENEKVKFLIQDNGKGFDVNTKHLNSLGMKTLQERINFLKGVFQIDSQLNKGTKLQFSVPL